MIFTNNEIISKKKSKISFHLAKKYVIKVSKLSNLTIYLMSTEYTAKFLNLLLLFVDNKRYIV